MSQTLKNFAEAGPRIGGPFLVGQVLSNRLVNGSDAFSAAYCQHLAEAKVGKEVLS